MKGFVRILGLTGILGAYSLGAIAFAEEELDLMSPPPNLIKFEGQYWERDQHKAWIKVDEHQYLSTNANITYGDGSISLTMKFPHRVRRLGQTNVFEASGTMSTTWHIGASSWNCDYSVLLTTDLDDSGIYADVTYRLPNAMIHPTTYGSCPCSGLRDLKLSYVKEPATVYE